MESPGRPLLVPVEEGSRQIPAKRLDAGTAWRRSCSPTRGTSCDPVP